MVKDFFFKNIIEKLGFLSWYFKSFPRTFFLFNQSDRRFDDWRTFSTYFTH